MISEKIEILNFELQSSVGIYTDVITNVSYLLTLTDDESEKMVQRVNTSNLHLNSSDFIEYSSITEQNIIDWIKLTDTYQKLFERLTLSLNLLPKTIINSENFPWNN